MSTIDLISALGGLAILCLAQATIAPLYIKAEATGRSVYAAVGKGLISMAAVGIAITGFTLLVLHAFGVIDLYTLF